MNATIAKQFSFSAGHHLPKVPEGHPCRRTHGHNYVVEIEVTGPVDPMLGWVTDFSSISVYMKVFLEELDHRYLNDILENPTAENLALWFLDCLKKTALLNDDMSLSVTVWETPKCWARVSQ